MTMLAPSAGLETLPTELFLRVAGQLVKEDLKDLSLASKKCHSVVAEPLWKTATIKPLSESDLHQIDAAAVPLSLLQFAQQLHFLSDFRLVLKNRCPHHKDAKTLDASTHDGPTPSKVDEEGKSHIGSRPGAEETGNKHPDYFRHLAHQAKSILEQLQHDQLNGFSWDMGTCVPPELLGPRGIVLLNNPSLRSLSLTTDPNCHRSSADCEIDLSPLRQLQSLRWRGPETRHFETLCYAIENNADNLQRLDLDFITWYQFRDALKLKERVDFKANAWCANKIFGLTKQPSQPLFPAIRELSLTQVPVIEGMGQRIGLETLVSLKLRNCRNWPELLEEIVVRGDPIRLKTLEIRDSEGLTWRSVPETMNRFLTAFEGLEELFMCYWNSSKRDFVERWNLLSSGVWNGAAHHRATLKRLGYNRRETVWVHPEADVPDEGLYSWAINETNDGPSQHPLAGLDLDFIGLSCAPRLLVPILLPFASKTSLRVLHIRQSGHGWSLILNEEDEVEGADPKKKDLDENQADTADSYDAAIRARLQPDFNELAEWAFGPRGICSLQAIAYGDFTYGGKRPPPVDQPFFRRERVDQLLFCRSKCSGDGDHSNFRAVRKKDPEARILDEYRDTLQALPMESLMVYSK